MIYASITIGGIWVKADSKDRAAIRALKAWWSTQADQRVDYKDHTMTIDQRYPCYAIFSLGRGEKAVKKLQTQMKKLGAEVLEITTADLLKMIDEEDFRRED